VKGLLLFLVLMGTLAALSSSVLAQPSSKIDPELQAVLSKSTPFELINIIVVFQSKPTDDQVNTLKTAHGMIIMYRYSIINGVAGKAPATEIPKIAEYDWVKEIWLDKAVYTLTDKTVKVSELMEALEEENDKLRQTISDLNQEISGLEKQIQDQWCHISQLETDLKIYPCVSFIAGLIVGVATIDLMRKVRRPTK